MLHSVSQSCPTLCDPMDCSPPGSSVHGSLQARIPEWVAMPSSRGSSPPRDQTHGSCTAGRFFTAEPMGKPSFSSTEFFFYFNKHILSFECFFFITSCSFFIDVLSSPFLLRILNIDFFFFYYILLPVLSLYSLSSYCFLFCSCQPITIVTCLSYLMSFDHLL